MITIHKNKICIYAHSIKGVIFYIGKGTSERPFENLNKTKRNQLWHDKVNQHGSFDVNILAWFDLCDNDASIIEEAKLIREFKPECNQHLNGYETSQLQKLRCSEAHRGKVLTDLTKEKISIKMKGKLPWCTGLNLSQETIEKMRASRKKQSRMIVRSDGVKFNSTKGAAKDLEIPASTLRAHLNGKLTHACGMVFSYV